MLDFFDLSVFCFRAPYHFKQEADLLKVEVGLKGRKLRKIESMIRRAKKRKRGKACHFSSDDDDEEEEDEEIMDAAEAKDQDVFLDDDVHVTGSFFVEAPDQSGNNYLVNNRNVEEDDPPYKPYGDDGDTDNGTETQLLDHYVSSG